MGTGCNVICADSVANEDRATAQNLCVTFSSIAYLITLFGGLTMQGIRPVYYIRFLGCGLVFHFVAAQLREPREARATVDGAGPSFIGDFRQLFEGGGPLRRRVIIVALTGLTMAMASPFPSSSPTR